MVKYTVIFFLKKVGASFIWTMDALPPKSTLAIMFHQFSTKHLAKWNFKQSATIEHNDFDSVKWNFSKDLELLNNTFKQGMLLG